MELPIRYLNEKGQLDDGESSQLRYVYDIMYGEGEPYHNADWSVVIYPSEVKLVDIPTAAEIFTERYNTDQILCRIYSNVDEKKEIVESYEFRSISIEEETTDMTKEDILQAIKEMEGLKLW